MVYNLLDTLVMLTNVFFILGGLAAGTLMLIAYKRFKKNEFSNIVKFFALAVMLTVMYKIAEVLDEYYMYHYYITFFLMHLFLFLAMLASVWTAFLLLKYSRLPPSSLPED
ncbi:MAG: hypothetical protein AB1467_02070 [Candidatus Diapherotrites archaeon]